ncbi:MAG: type II secretion system F family protein [Microthrixaceae bacterium]
MMLPIAWVLLALGFTFVLGEAPWFRRAGVVDRLAPYRRHRPTDPTRRTSESIRAVLAPGIERWGERASSMLGVRQQLSTRLEQAGWSVDPTSFRMRQAAFAGVTFVAGAAFTVALTPRPVVAVVAIVGLPLLAALIEERRLDSAVEERRSRRQEELPVVTEQLGLLLSAGYSVPSALNRLAQRGDGTIASDLRAVSRRIRQGLSTNAALAEWADDSGVDAIGRLVAVLRLHDDAGDLGQLVSQEARSARAAMHRDLLETIERRSQLVWVPVTVATLLPGLIFLAVPFTSAMAQVAGG